MLELLPDWEGGQSVHGGRLDLPVIVSGGYGRPHFRRLRDPPDPLRRDDAPRRRRVKAKLEFSRPAGALTRLRRGGGEAPARGLVCHARWLPLAGGGGYFSNRRRQTA